MYKRKCDNHPKSCFTEIVRKLHKPVGVSLGKNVDDEFRASVDGRISGTAFCRDFGQQLSEGKHALCPPCVCFNDPPFQKALTTMHCVPSATISNSAFMYRET